MLRHSRLDRSGLALLTVLMLSSSTPIELHAAGTISGVVFEDFNGNGTRDQGLIVPNVSGKGVAPLATDRGLAGITVTAYDAAGSLQGTAITAADGSYTLIAGGSGPYRVEFSGLPVGFFSGPHGADNNTTVQFVPDGSSANVSLGLVRPADYSQDAPDLVTSIYVFGDQVSGPNNAQPTLISFPYNAGAAEGTPGEVDYQQPATHALSVPASQIGTTWGLAYSGITQTVYAAAFTKKFAGYGPNGNGAIYRAARTGATASLYADLNQIFGAGTAGVDFRGTPTWLAQGGFSADGFNTGWDAVGKSALGGLDVSPDGRTLYVMNLADGQLYILPTSGALDASTVQRVPVPNPITAANSDDRLLDFRPFAVTYYNGRVYVGAINSAESTQDPDNLRAYVLAFDPSTGGFDPAPVLQFDLNYPRGIGNALSVPASSADWLPWTPVFRNLAIVGLFDPDTLYPQPWLTGLAFAPNGDLVIGLRDRTGDQVGVQTPDDPAQPSTLRRGIAVGDVLRASFDASSGTYTLESNASVGGNTSAGTGNGQGPGGGEFYFEDYTPGPGGAFPIIHDELSVGGVLQVPGTSEMATTTINPNKEVSFFSRGGVRWFDNVTGEMTRGYEAYYSGPVSTAAITFSKANGVGDLIALSDPPRVEIGNRVWLDADADGVQDPQEAPIAGATVRLYGPDGSETVLLTTTTDAAGRYYFSGLLLAAATFSIRLDAPADYATGGPLAGLLPTVAGAGPAHIDSNGTAASPSDVRAAAAVGGPGQNDHTFDFGFVPGADIAVQKIVDMSAPPGGVISVVPGEPFTFWIKVVNHGPAAATNVVVSDVLPPGFRLVAFGASQGTFDLPTAVWTVGGLPVGGMAQLDLAAVVDQPGTLTNTAGRTASQPGDPNPANDTSSATFVVSPQPDVAITGTFLPSLTSALAVDAAHRVVTMRFHVRNTSRVPVTATRVQAALRVSDSLPSLTIMSASPSQGAIDAAAAAWDVGPLPPGASASVDVVATVDGAARIQFEVRRASTIPGDSWPGNDGVVLTLQGIAPNTADHYLALGDTRGTGTGDLVVGSNELEPTLVQIYDATHARSLAFPIGAGVGGVRVAVCDLDVDGRDDIITAAGLPDGGPQVRVFSRRLNGTMTELASWYSVDRDYRGGIHVACGDVDGDGVPEVVTGSGAEGPAIVQVWKPDLRAGTARELGRGTLGAIAPGFGVRVAACDVTGDGRAEIVAAPAGGSTPAIWIFEAATAGLLYTFPAARPGEAAGLQVACGNVMPAAGNEIIVGLELGGSPVVRAFTPQGTLLGEYAGFAPAPGAAVRVAVGEVDGNPDLDEFALASGAEPGEVVVGSARFGVTRRVRVVP